MIQELKLIGMYVKKHIWQYIFGIAALFIVDRVNTLIPLLTGEITDGLASGTLDMNGVWQIVLRMVLMGLTIAVGRFCWRYFLFGASRSIEKEMRNDLFGHLETLSMRYFNSHKTGDLMAHFTNDLQSVRQLLGMTVITTFDATVMLILVLHSMIRYVSVHLTLVSVIPMVLIIIGDIFFGKIMHKRFLEKQAAFSELTNQVQESVSGIRVIKAFVQERLELQAFCKNNANNREKNMQVVRLHALVMPLLNLVIGVSVLITLLYGGYLAILGEITVGQFVAFNSYITMLVWPMIAVGECISSFSQGMASMRRVKTILDEKPDITDTADCDKSLTSIRGEIDFENLSFAYHESTGAPLLDGISVHVAQGETLAIIGRTGCGKSTLVSLLARLYDLKDPGMLRIDRRPLTDYPLSVLRSQIAFVPQDSFLFSDTIANNIAFGLDDAPMELIQKAARNACVHDAIMEFPDQYETRIGERGVTLSGGQKQRVAIARALVKDAPILVLDDSLSAVDTDTEKMILESLKRERAGKTTLMIAHRLSSVQHADHILVLDDGRAAEYGTHEELLAHNGLYKSIWDKQQLEKSLQAEGENAQ